MSYMPTTRRGEEMYAAGVDEATIREYEAQKFAFDSAQGQAAFYQRHPEVQHSPEIQARIDATMARDPQRYARVGEAGGPHAAYELAFAESQSQPEQSDGGGRSARVRSGVDLMAARERVTEAQQEYKRSGYMPKAFDIAASPAQRQMLHHPDFDM